MSDKTESIVRRFKGKGAVLGAEVGVYQGRNALALLKKLPGLKLVLVDPWEPVEYCDEGVDKELSEKTRKKKEGMYELNGKHNKAAAMANLMGFEDRFEVWETSSREGAGKAEAGMFDFVFIDISHSYADEKEAIVLWKEKVKKGGWLCGHDYGRKMYPGVKKAVDEVLGRVELDKDNTWFYKIK